MTRKHRPHPAPSDAPPEPPFPERASAPGAGEDAGAAAALADATPGAETGALVEPAAEALRRVEQEAAEWRDRCLRAAAEFENYKKRQIKERADTTVRAQGDLIVRVLDAVDDLARVAALDPSQTGAEALHEGVGLVERKLLKALEGVGLERVDPTGHPFDPNLHEAVMTVPAPGPEADHTVGSVLQPGYRLNGTLLRPARVAVYTWTEPAAEEAAQ
jgi:molecular chaperone GrpE